MCPCFEDRSSFVFIVIGYNVSPALARRKVLFVMGKINDEMELFTLEPEFEIGHIFIGRNMFWRHYIAAGMQTYSTTQRSRMHVTAALKVFPVYCWTLGFTALGISSCCETSVWTFIVSFTAIVFNWWSSSSLISPWFDTHVAFVKNVFTRL